MSRIMLVDDEPNVTHALARLLRREWGEAVTVEAFNDPREALRRAEERSFDVILSDYRMPPMDGVALLVAIRTLQPQTSRLILSASQDFDVILGAINKAGILRFIAKPWKDAEVIHALSEGIAASTIAREDTRLADERRCELDEADARQRAALHSLEALEPGITKVHWGPNGEVLLDD